MGLSHIENVVFARVCVFFNNYGFNILCWFQEHVLIKFLQCLLFRDIHFSLAQDITVIFKLGTESIPNFQRALLAMEGAEFSRLRANTATRYRKMPKC